MKLSILIPTLIERRDKFNFIRNKIQGQITSLKLDKEIEIISFEDNRKYNVGYKRNWLLDQAKGVYSMFVDDDDDVSNNFIKLVYDALKTNPDCVSLTGIITFNGHNPKRFVHSLKYKSYFESGGVYYRPPNHLNPIKTEIAKKFRFPELNFGEDTNWAMQVCKSGILKKEVEVSEPYYYYRFDQFKRR